MTTQEVRAELEPLGFKFQKVLDFLPWQHIIIFTAGNESSNRPTSRAHRILRAVHCLRTVHFAARKKSRRLSGSGRSLGPGLLAATFLAATLEPAPTVGAAGLGYAYGLGACGGRICGHWIAHSGQYRRTENLGARGKERMATVATISIIATADRFEV